MGSVNESSSYVRERATLMSSVNEVFLFFLRKRTSNPNE